MIHGYAQNDHGDMIGSGEEPVGITVDAVLTVLKWIHFWVITLVLKIFIDVKNVVELQLMKENKSILIDFNFFLLLLHYVIYPNNFKFLIIILPILLIVATLTC